MMKDNLPPSEAVTGHCKRHLTEKAKQAVESQPRKKVKTSEGSWAIQETASTTATRRKTVSIEEVDDKDDCKGNRNEQTQQTHD